MPSLRAGIVALALLTAGSAAGQPLLGSRLTDVRTHDFFTHFNLVEVDETATVDEHVVKQLKPRAGRLRELVTVRVTVDADDRILAMAVWLDRRFVDHPLDGAYARDIAHSLLVSALADEDRTRLATLIAQIGPARAGHVTFAKPPPPMPEKPAPGYLTYLGRRTKQRHRLDGPVLELRNHDPSETTGDDSGATYLSLRVWLGPS